MDKLGKVGASPHGPSHPAAPHGWKHPDAKVNTSCGTRYLVLVTAVAAFFRLWRLDAAPLWADELFTWHLVTPQRGHSFIDIVAAVYQGPLFHATVWLTQKLHESPAMLRLPSALASIMAVPLLGIFAAKLWGRQAGRLAALLLCLSPFAVWYAQEGRGYSFLILFAVAAGLVVQTCLQHGPTPKRSLALAALCFAGLCSNLSFIFLLPAFALTVLLVAPPNHGRGWLMWSVGLLGGLAMASHWLMAAAGIWELGRILPGADLGEALRGQTTSSIWTLPYTGYSFLYGFSLGPSVTELHEAGGLQIIRAYLPILVPATLLAVLAWLPGLRALTRRRWVILLWILLPVMAVIVLSLRNIKPFNVRYAAAAFPWVMALMAAGICRWRRPWRQIIGAGLCLLLLISLIGYHYVPRYTKGDVREALAVIKLSDRPERPLLVPGAGVGRVVLFYWSGDGQVLDLFGAPILSNAAMADELVQQYLADTSEAWIIWARASHLDPYNHLPTALALRGTLERYYTGHGVTVDLWRCHPTVQDEP